MASEPRALQLEQRASQLVRELAHVVGELEREGFTVRLLLRGESWRGVTLDPRGMSVSYTQVGRAGR